jgi:hypothetical protein
MLFGSHFFFSRISSASSQLYIYILHYAHIHEKYNNKNNNNNNNAGGKDGKKMFEWNHKNII